MLDDVTLAIRLFLANTQRRLTSQSTALNFGDRETAEPGRRDANLSCGGPPPAQAARLLSERAASGVRRLCDAINPRAAARPAAFCAVAARAARRLALGGGGLRPGMLQRVRWPPPCSRPRSSSLSAWRPTRRASGIGR